MTDEKLDGLLKEALKPEIRSGELAIDQSRKDAFEKKEMRKTGAGRKEKWIAVAASASAACLLLVFGITYGNHGNGSTALQEVKQVETAAPTDDETKQLFSRSQIYSEADIDSAEAVVRAEFDSWQDAENLQLSYMGDSCNVIENIQWMNDLNERQKVSDVPFTQCLAFTSTFHTKKDLKEYTWEPDEDYDGYQWWLARSDGGEWHLMTWGY